MTKLTYEDIEFFLETYADSEFIQDTRPMPFSEFVMVTPHTYFIEKRYPTKIINTYSKDKFFNLLKIAQKGYFTFLIYDFGFLAGFEYTKEDIARIKEIFKIYIMEEGDGATINIIEDSLEDTTRWATFKLDSKYATNDLLDAHLAEFQELLYEGFYLQAEAFDKWMLVRNILEEWRELYKNITDTEKNLLGRKLYRDIMWHLWKKTNDTSEIVLAYEIGDFLRNKYYYYELLYKLHQKSKLNIRYIKIRKQQIYLHLEEFKDIEKELFYDTFIDNIDVEGACFFEEKLYVKWYDFNFQKNSATKELLQLYYDYRKVHNKKWERFVKYEDLKAFMTTHQKNFPNLYNSYLEKGYRFDDETTKWLLWQVSGRIKTKLSITTKWNFFWTLSYWIESQY